VRSNTESRIILNADDFGGSTSINAAVLQAHRDGVLTSTSLMVTGEAVEEAVALARKMPSLAVGLHLVVVAGRPALAPQRVPHLVGGNGRFADNPLRAGLHYFFSRAARHELAQEVEAQFEQFAATGLTLSHVDGHMHMHLHPTVLGLLAPLAVAHGASGVRLPRDDLQLGLAYDRDRMGQKVAWWAVFGLLSRCSSRRIGPRHLVAPERVYGLLQTGQMEESYVLRVLDQLRESSAELYFHPAMGPQEEAMGSNPGDLQALLSPSVRRVIEERGIRLATYSTLRSE
jgi:hopanoid biosynthesis associated protein HpnK